MADQAQIPLWPDNPTAEDLLGFSDVAEPIVDALKRDRLDPVAVGISGDWGAGKTTILEIAKAALEGDTSIVVVYTRPWEYDPATDPKATLIGEVLGAVERRTEERDGGLGDLKDRFIDLGKRVRWSRALTLAAKTAVTFSPPKFEEIADLFVTEEGDAAADPTLQGFRDDFAQLMGDIDEITRVVVLVDDLDRCLPESVIGALEAIKLFLSVEKMGFVIAADERLVTHAIATRYQGATQADRMAREYLEKIVQIPIRVPALGESDTEAYMALLLVHHHLFSEVDEDEAQRRFTTIVEHCAAKRAASARRVLEDLPDDLVPAPASEEVALSSQLAPLLAAGMSGNPRKIKRFLNAYWLRSDIARRRAVTLEAPAMAKLLFLEQVEPEQFDQLLTWLAAGNLKSKLKELEEAEDATGLGATESGLWTWARQRPHLADEELGPYLRLAASLKSMPGASTDLRSELQELLERLISDVSATRDQAQTEALALPPGDKSELVKEIVRVIQTEPGRQDDASDSLKALADGDERVATALAGALAGLDASIIEPGLIIRLQGLEAMQSVIAQWLESGRLGEIAEKAARSAVDDGKA